MALSLPLLLSTMVRAPPPAWFAPSMLPAAQVAEAMRKIASTPNTFVVVDGNNVRGRVNFRLSKAQLSSLLSTWAARHGLSERVVVCWDHGQQSEALVWRGVCHAFAGPRQSADDVIAIDALPSLLRSPGCERVWVVTTDRELLWRCKQAAVQAGSPQGRLRFLGTAKLVSLLMDSREGEPTNEPLLGEPPSEPAGLAAADADPVAHAFTRSSTELQRWVASQRKLRRHERLRRRRPDGFSAPFAEKTWMRVILAERLRRLLRRHASTAAAAAAAPPAAPPPARPAAVAGMGAFVEVLNLKRASATGGSAVAAARRGGEQAGKQPPISETLLGDVRLDGRQRALMLRLGAALSEGPLAAEDAAAAEEADPPAERGSWRPTRRMRRQQRARKEGDRAGGARDSPAARGSLTEEQLHALALWLGE